MCPLQLVVITGLPVIACSSNGLPNPSPLVNETNALILGSTDYCQEIDPAIWMAHETYE